MTWIKLCNKTVADRKRNRTVSENSKDKAGKQADRMSWLSKTKVCGLKGCAYSLPEHGKSLPGYDPRKEAFTGHNALYSDWAAMSRAVMERSLTKLIKQVREVTFIKELRHPFNVAVSSRVVQLLATINFFKAVGLGHVR